MRLYTENAPQYISALSSSIERDPLSMEAWICMHIETKEQATIDTGEIDTIKKANRSLDCDMIICPDNDIFIIGRSRDLLSISRMAERFSSMLSEGSEIVRYELFSDWKKIHSLLEDKTRGRKMPLSLKLESGNFEDTAHLEHVFNETKQLRPDRHPQYVMLVEDDPMTRRLATSILKKDCAVISADNAHDAVANYLMHAPDIVFLDIGLPDQSGFTVLKQILEIDPDAYVVMFSGNSYIDNVTKSLNAGASGFVAKPFQPDKMRRYIEDSAMHHRKIA